MALSKIATATLLAIATLFVSVSAAMANNAAATTSLNVRSGPGTGFAVIGTLAPNQVVNVIECNQSNTWCRIQERNLQGWASARYLRPVTGGPSRPTQPSPSQPGFGVTIGSDGFSFSFGVGTPSAQRGEVCFYERMNFNGRSFCARPGDSERALSSNWNNRISSIRIEGNAEVTICDRPNLRGVCSTISRSVRSLGSLNNSVSSYRVGR